MREAITKVVASIVVVVVVIAAVGFTLLFQSSGTMSSTETTSFPASTSSKSSFTVSSSSLPTVSTSSAVSTLSSKQSMNLKYGYTGFIPGGYTASILAAAVSLGTWSKHNLDVTLVQFPGGEGTVLSAMVAGSIDVGDAGPLSLATALAAGADVKMFGAEMVDSGYAVVVSSTSTIASLSQVKGTKFSMGVTSVGSGTWVNAHLMATAAGLKEGTDYTVVSLGSPNAQFAALKQGTVQSTIFPVAAALGFASRLNMSIRFIANSTNLLPKPWVDLGFVAPAKYIPQHQAELKAFLQGYVDAYNYFKNNQTWALGFIQSYYKVNATLAREIYPVTVAGFAANTTVSSQALENTLGLAERAGIIANTTSLPPASNWYVNIT